jgi:hypothetical protein
VRTSVLPMPALSAVRIAGEPKRAPRWLKRMRQSTWSSALTAFVSTRMRSLQLLCSRLGAPLAEAREPRPRFRSSAARCTCCSADRARLAS